ncbi:MAG: hypothetical protein MR270_04385 [Erysipelotrichaceae bacterium]|nr:hypothetical protein [Erysipelotrichaceae bacterium]
MLEKHFFIKSDSKTKSDNIILYNDYRISILFNELIRIEKSESGKFLDEPTTAILFRNFEKVPYNTQILQDGIMINLSNISYFIANNFIDSYVLLNEKKVKLDNEGNLKGTFEGLDGCDGDINDHYANPAKPLILQNGVCSLSGVAFIDDSSSKVIKEDGLLYKRDSEEIDVYVFAYGHNFQDAVKAFYKISGNVPLVPRFALGNWWSRYHDYTDVEYEYLMDRFLKNNIPITVATIDMDWHPSTNLIQYYHLDTLNRLKIEYGFNKDEEEWKWGWTGYSWDLSRFKNPKKFLKNIHQKNMKICLNLHPNDIKWYEKEYQTLAKDLNINVDKLQPIPLNFQSADFINAYFNDLHKNLEHEGVDFWWIDDVNYLFELSHFYFLDNSKEKQPLILCRYAGIGSHRYPLGFSGDSVISWKSLEYLPYFTATASNIGYSWWSHDIGAFMAGVKDDELYLRYVQLGVFLPILRLHCQNNIMLTKEPWAYKNGIGDIVCNHLRLRHRLIPYLYSASYRNSNDNLALVEPLYYYYPEDKNVYNYKNEYMFNGNLLVVPITKHSKNKLSEIEVYLPKGMWTDIFTNTTYEGGKKRKMIRTLDSIPVFASKGSIVALSDDKISNSIANPKNLQVDVYNGTSSFTLYEDNEGNNKSFTYFETQEDGNKQYLSIMFDDGGALPKLRNYHIFFKNIIKGKVYCNHKALIINHEDCIEVVLKNRNSSDMIEIEIIQEKEDRIEKIKRHAKNTIIYFEGKNDDRVALYKLLMDVKTINEYIKVVNNAKISRQLKIALKECI